MEHLEEYLNSSSSKEAAKTMCPSQTMMVAAVCLGISDAKGITWALGCAMLLRPHISMLLQGHPVSKKCIQFPQHKTCRLGPYIKFNGSTALEDFFVSDFMLDL